MNDELKKFVQGELERITVKISTGSGFKGTGFFITTDGYILTAWHCIQEVTNPHLGHDINIEYEGGGNFSARLEKDKSIKDSDIAVLKTEIELQINDCVPLGRIPKNPKGDEVISVGYPGIHRNNAGMGIYSGSITRFVNRDLEVEGALKGQGQSGGLVYHYATHRIIGVVKKIYGGKDKETLLQDAGLAAKVDAVFSKWEGLSGIQENIAKSWDKCLETFTIKTDLNTAKFQEKKAGNGKIKIQLCQRLGDDWKALADYLEIPPYRCAQFPTGDECRAIWRWLEERKQLHTLQEALNILERQDLVELLNTI